MEGDSRQDGLTVNLRNDLGEIAVLVDRIEAYCAEQGLPADIQHALHLSLDELLTNTISYGYDGGEAHADAIRVVFGFDGTVVTVEITDDARAFDPFTAPEPDIGAALEDRSIGGLGVFLVKHMMDGYEYRYEDGRNVVTLTKNVEPDAGGQSAKE